MCWGEERFIEAMFPFVPYHLKLMRHWSVGTLSLSQTEAELGFPAGRYAALNPPGKPRRLSPDYRHPRSLYYLPLQKAANLIWMIKCCGLSRHRQIEIKYLRTNIISGFFITYCLLRTRGSLCMDFVKLLLHIIWAIGKRFVNQEWLPKKNGQKEPFVLKSKTIIFWY